MKRTNKIVGITFSQFDLLHAGHVCMLAEAKRYCDHLIVGLHNNANVERAHKNAPIQSIYERQLIVSAIKYVDEVIVYNTEKDVEDILSSLPINVRFLGEEYRDAKYTGKEICERRNISIHFTKRDHSFSSSELRKRVKEG